MTWFAISHSGGQIGPYRSVETRSDHYLADGVIVYFSILPSPHSVVSVDAPEPFVPVPEEVPQWQARRALLAAGLLASVEAAVAAASQDIQITWEYAPNIRRDSPFVASMAAALNLTSQQLDDLFRAAAQIT